MTQAMEHANRLGKTLLIWSGLSLIVGIVLYLNPVPLIQGIGLQAILWGIIDAIIALFGVIRQKEESPEKMAKVLLVNVGLDIVYQIVGAILILFFWLDPFIVGNGIGVIIQGAFLFILDLFYYRIFKKL